MKEDILEQIVDDYLHMNGYFTKHNIKYRPDRSHPDYNPLQDSNHSDIDIIGYNPALPLPYKAVAVSCKSYQSGFNPRSKIDEIENNKTVGGREAWKFYRELVNNKWSEAFIEAVFRETRTRYFTYYTAVTWVNGDRSQWTEYFTENKALNGNNIEIITLSEILNYLFNNTDSTLASSLSSRLIQVIKAAQWSPEY